MIGIIYGALGCLAQTDMKRLIAFSSVAHMGFVMLGIATLTTFGINAAIFGMVAHGLITGMLFFIAGSVQERYGTREISRLGGLLMQAPQHGLDPRLLRDGVARPARPRRVLGRVPGDPLGVSARRRASAQPLFRIYMVVAAIGTVLAAGYLLWMFQRVAFGVPKAEFAGRAHPRRPRAPSGSRGRRCSSLIVVLGVFPNIMFHVTDRRRARRRDRRRER